MDIKKLVQFILTVILGIIIFRVVFFLLGGVFILFKFAISIGIFVLIIYVIYKLFNKYLK